MRATDAIAWLQQFDGHLSLERLGRLDVAPVLAPGSTFLPGTDEHSLSAFGFGADGAMVNGTYLFALVAFVLFAVVQGTTVPPCVCQVLAGHPGATNAGSQHFESDGRDHGDKCSAEHGES